MTSSSNMDMEVMFINGREFEVKSNQPSRVVLNSYVQHFKLEKPIFEMKVRNESDTRFRIFIVTMRVEGKEVVACGQSKKKAESAAAWKFCNNISHSGGSSLRYGKMVSASTVHKNRPTPSKKIKAAAKWEKFMRAKDEASNTNAAVNKVQEAAADMVVEEGNVSKEPVFVTVDLEKAAGPVDAEMIQLAYNAASKSGCSYILPNGALDRIAAKKSHHLEKFGNSLSKNGKIIKHESLEVAAQKFLDFLSEVGAESNQRKIVLISHGGNDIPTLMNHFAKVGLDEELTNCIGGMIDSFEVFNEDGNFKCLSLTSTKVSKNLAEEILMEGVTREEIIKNAHDAVYDAQILAKVWAKYYGSQSPLSQNIIEENYMRLGSSLVSWSKDIIRKARDRRARRGQMESVGYDTFNGWN